MADLTLNEFKTRNDKKLKRLFHIEAKKMWDLDKSYGKVEHIDGNDDSRPFHAVYLKEPLWFRIPFIGNLFKSRN